MKELIINKPSKLNTIRGPKLDNPQQNLSQQKIFISDKNEAEFKEFRQELQADADIKFQTNIVNSYENSLRIDLSREAPSESLSVSDTKIQKSKNISLKVREKEQRGLYLINIFKRAKNFAVKIKKNLFYQQYNNLSNSQGQIINDLSHFPQENQKGFPLKVNNNNFFIKKIKKVFKGEDKKCWKVFSSSLFKNQSSF